MRLLFGLCLFLFPSVAHADWLQASSTHFVIYANASESGIRRLSEQLERYDGAMAVVTRLQRQAPSPSNRVTVYVVGNVEQVRRLAGDKTGNIAGFYRPRAGGSLAVIPPVTAARGELEFPMIVLLHEYAHHFLISNDAFPMPRWMNEGAAEFFASASFGTDGSIGLGEAANHRSAELFYAPDVTVRDLLDPTAYDKRKRTLGEDAFYGKSWLLYHYLVFSKSRAGQLASYAALMMKGKSSADAGREAFGDFAVLEHELDKYLAQPTLMTIQFPAKAVPVSAAVVRKLGAGETAMMPTRIRSSLGVNRQQAKELLPEARSVAARFPGDAYVLSALAEAEHDAGNDGESIAAADAALAIDRTQVNAYYQKGLSLLRQAGKVGDQAHPNAPDRLAAFNAARKPFQALNRLENDHPVPLIYYYLSFVEQGVETSPLAFSGLKRAVEVAPFDPDVRMMLAMADLKAKDRDGARANLTLIAYNPHGGGLAKVAQEALARLDRDPGWDGSDFKPASDDAKQEPGSPGG